jgi:hypothetical protein
MKKLVMVGGALLLLCGVSGCGSDSHDKLVQEMIDVLNGTRSVLHEIKDEKTAEQKAGELKKKGEQLRELKKRAEGLREALDPDEKARLEKEYKRKLEEAIARLSAEWDRVKKIEGVPKILTDKGALDDFGYGRTGSG